MADRKKHVESVPAGWVDAVRSAVDSGSGFKDAVAGLFTINAQLLVFARQQRATTCSARPIAGVEGDADGAAALISPGSGDSTAPVFTTSFVAQGNQRIDSSGAAGRNQAGQSRQSQYQRR